MARKIQNRRDLRKQADAADSQAGDEGEDDLDDLEVGDEPEIDADLDLESEDEDGPPKRKKKAAKKAKTTTRAKRSKTKAIVRKRMLWGVFGASMKEEARFPLADKELAEQKAEALRQKNKREYFLQRIKEPIADAPAPAAAAAAK